MFKKAKACRVWLKDDSAHQQQCDSSVFSEHSSKVKSTAAVPVPQVDVEEARVEHRPEHRAVVHVRHHFEQNEEKLNFGTKLS